MTTTVNIVQDNVVIDVVQETPTINVVNNLVTLDIASGGIVAANVDTVLQAATNISALRAITTDASGNAVYADNATANGSIVVGISTNAANAGANVTIKTSGTITDNSFSFSKGQIYLGSNGTLTQTAPTNGAYVVPIARALTATSIFVDIDNSIQTV